MAEALTVRHDVDVAVGDVAVRRPIDCRCERAQDRLDRLARLDPAAVACEPVDVADDATGR